jgi:hypothetical protein
MAATSGIGLGGDQRGDAGGLRAGVGVGRVQQGDGLVPGQACRPEVA